MSQTETSSSNQFKPQSKKMKISIITTGINVYIFCTIRNTAAGVPSAITATLTATTTYLKKKGLKGVAKDIDSMVSIAKNAKNIKDFTSEISNEFNLDFNLGSLSQKGM